MSEELNLGTINNRTVSLIFRDDEIIQVEKSSNPTFQTNTKYNYQVFTYSMNSTSTTTTNLNIKTVLYLKDSYIVINGDLKATAGWHVKTVFVKIGNETKICGRKIVESGYFLQDNTPSKYIGLSIAEMDTGLTRIGTDEYGKAVYTMEIPEGGIRKKSSIPEADIQEKCYTIGWLSWILILPVVWLLKKITGHIPENLQFLLSYKYRYYLIIPAVISLICYIRYKSLDKIVYEKIRLMNKEEEEATKNQYNSADEAYRQFMFLS